MRRASFILILFALAISACSIKEDRTGVPCCLRVYYEDAEFNQTHRRTILSTQNGSQRISFDTLCIADYSPADAFEVFMPKGYGKLSSIAGFEQTYFLGDSLLTRTGLGFDRIFAYASEPDCRWDTGRDYVRFSKQYCIIYIKPKTPVAGYYPYEMRIRSATKGMDIYSLEPIKGEFYAFASKNRDGTLSVIVPRQYDDSMMLDIMTPEGDTEASFQLGKMIRASGFDWNSVDLNDVVATIDYASMSIVVIVQDWDSEDFGEIII